MSKYPDFMDPKCSFRMFLMSINIIPIPISIPILRISPDSSGLPAFTTCLAQGIHENHVAPDTSLPHPLQQRQGEEPWCNCFHGAWVNVKRWWELLRTTSIHLLFEDVTVNIYIYYQQINWWIIDVTSMSLNINSHHQSFSKYHGHWTRSSSLTTANSLQWSSTHVPSRNSGWMPFEFGLHPEINMINSDQLKAVPPIIWSSAAASFRLQNLKGSNDFPLLHLQ